MTMIKKIKIEHNNFIVINFVFSKDKILQISLHVNFVSLILFYFHFLFDRQNVNKSLIH
jgi:hypothetical protein